MPLTLGEMVRESNTIVIGTFLNATPRQTGLDGRVIVTDYRVRIDDMILAGAGNAIDGTEMTLTFWGGTIGTRTQAIAGMPAPVVGEAYVLFLHDPSARSVQLVPTVGMPQGLVRIVRESSGVRVLQESDGAPLRASIQALVGTSPSVAAAPRPVEAEAFILALKSNLAALRATPRAALLMASREPGAGQRLPKLTLGDDVAPSQSPTTAPVSSATASTVIPAPPRGRDGAPVIAADRVMATAEPLPHARYVTRPRGAKVWPITVNQLPAALAPWAIRDVEQLQKWNYYADVFRAAAVPSSFYRFGNGRFDVAGFLTDADLQAGFGSTWGSGVIGITFLEFDGDQIAEADVALNAAFTWTLDDESIYAGGFSRSYRGTLLHEFGHMWGALHFNESLAQMGYSPRFLRGYTMPYTDDAEAVRGLYPAVPRSDLGIYLYRWTRQRGQFFDAPESNFPWTVQSGDAITVGNYTIENVGTATIQQPRVEWYLTTSRNFDDSYIFLGEKIYNPLPRFSQFDPALTSSTLQLPSNTPAGRYYLAAFIRNDGGVTQDAFPYSNNMAFSASPIDVVPSCFYSVRGTRSVRKAGGTYTNLLETGSTCAWTTQSLSPFITVQPASGTGNATITYTVTPNTSYLARNGEFKVGAQFVGVIQWGHAPLGDYDGDGLGDVTVFRPSPGVWSTVVGDHTFGLPWHIPVPGDYNGDGITDRAMYDPSTSQWFIEGQAPIKWGDPGDTPVPADYNGDGSTDIAVYRLKDGLFGTWMVRGQFTRVWGMRGGDVPRPADVDGDRLADLIVFRPSTGTWHIMYSHYGDYSRTGVLQFGLPGDVPLVANLRDALMADLIVFRPSTGVWYITHGSNGFEFTEQVQWGAPGDVPIPMDLNDDRALELVVYRPSTGYWYSYDLLTEETGSVRLGNPGDRPIGEVPRIHPLRRDDFDGDGRADISIYRPSSGTWYSLLSRAGYNASNVTQFGLPGDVPVPADYDGDRKTDQAVFRPSTGMWYLRYSSTGQIRQIQWGLPGDVPFPIEYDDRDGRADLVVYRPSTGHWYVSTSYFDYWFGFLAAQWGLPGDIPVPADFDGNGVTDFAVYRPASGLWYIKLLDSISGSAVKQWGLPGDVPLPADFDADGRADLAVYRPSTGQWFIAGALVSAPVVIAQWGLPGDVSIVSDFDGDGAADISVFRPSSGLWFIRPSGAPAGSGGFWIYAWGVPGDDPLRGAPR